MSDDHKGLGLFQFITPSVWRKLNGRRRQAGEDHRDPATREGAKQAGPFASGSALPVSTSSDPYHYTFDTGGLSFKLRELSAYDVAKLDPTQRRYFLDELKPPKPQLPVEQQDMPILAHRSARLTFHGNKKPFASVSHHGGRFGVDCVAECNPGWGGFSIKNHAPDPDCSCGIYALPTDLDPTWNGKNYVTLQVELYGRVIVCGKGYRAAFQRVVECQLPACSYCGRQPELIHVIRGEMVEATCRAHDPWPRKDRMDPEKQYVCLDADDLDLPVPITRQGRG